MAVLSPQEAQAKNFVSFVVPDDAKLRLEIDELVVSSNELTNLYLLALEALQKEDKDKAVRKKAPNEENWWTFYSLSGIHGLPAENWNGIMKPDKEVGSYCTHGEMVFPTWHRVYMNMFEQAVTNKVLEIAAGFTKEPEKSLYDAAAKRFRIPFWDPFMPRNTVANPRPTRLGAPPDENIWGYPKILKAKRVFVKRPGTTGLDEIDNPLYSFKFPNKELTAKKRTPIDWSNMLNAARRPLPPKGPDYTIRAPDSTGEGNIANLELGLRRQIFSMGTNQWKLLSEYSSKPADAKINPDNQTRTWASFSTHNVLNPRTNQAIIDPDQWGGHARYQQDTAVSLESWHDTVHGLVGTGQGFSGHMGNPAIAGFDPIFWLHHCNIDRLLAIYQALYPDKWLSKADSTAALYPFKKSATEYWTSDDVKNWTKLGYAVPGNGGSIILDAKQRNTLEQHLYDFYNWAASGSTPPASVAEKWPKDLSGSIALYGTEAKVASAPVTEVTAFVGSKLVTRTLAVQAHAQAPLELKVQDVPTTVKIQEITANPAVAPPEIPTAKSVRTWNARIQVKKFAFNGSFNIHLFIWLHQRRPDRTLHN